MSTKNTLITKITAILLVIFLTFGNVAQASAVFVGAVTEVTRQVVVNEKDLSASTEESSPPQLHSNYDWYVDADNGLDSNDGSEPAPFKTIQKAITVATGGDSIFVTNGTYPEKLVIRKDIQITGESRDGTIIDTSLLIDYGVDADGDFITSFANLTLIGPGGLGYGFKINGDNAQTTITNVLVKDSHRTGIDLNGLNYAELTDVVTQNNGGAGFALTNCSNVTITNITTSGNAWSGGALYTNSTVNTQGSDNVSIVGTNSFGEVVGFYTQIHPDYPPTNLNTPDFGFMVINETAKPNQTLFAKDQDNANLIASGLTPASANVIRNIVEAEIPVTPGMSLKAAIEAAYPGDTVSVAAGTHVVSDTITVDKVITIEGEPGAKIQVSGTQPNFRMMAAATLKNLEIEKTDKVGNIVYLGSSGVQILNNEFHGQYNMGEPEVSRAIEVETNHFSDVVITGNTFHHLRQPAYINGTHTGLISNNYVYHTRGWVVAEGNFTFEGNTWGTGADANAVDIAIINTVSPQYYTDLPALAAANNNAVVEDQRGATNLLSNVYVDANAAPGGDGTPAHPYQTIAAGIARVVEGGNVHVAAGTYDEEDVLISKGLNLLGAAGNTSVIAPSGATNNSTIRVVNPSGDVLIDGFTFNNPPRPGHGATVLISGETIPVDSATVTVSNNIVNGADRGQYNDYGLYGQGNHAAVIWEYNTLNLVGGNPLIFEKQMGSTTVRYNTVYTGDKADGSLYYSMIYGNRTVDTPQIVENNTLSFVRTGAGWSEAITFNTSPTYQWGSGDTSGHYTNIQIRNNTIILGGPEDRGIGIADRSAGNGKGTITGVVIEGNTITGREEDLDESTVGVMLRGDVQGTQIKDNTFTTLATGVRIIEQNFGNPPDPEIPSGTVIENNTINTSVVVGVNSDSPDPVDASPNWWGSATGPTADRLVGLVTYNPYWITPEMDELNAPIVMNMSTGIPYWDLQTAVNAANAGNKLRLNAGTFTVTGSILVDKAISIEGRPGAKLEVSGPGPIFDMAAGATLKNLEIEKTDKVGTIVNLRSSGVQILDNVMHGRYTMGDPEVSRAIIVTAGTFSDVAITGNTFHHLRQPAYISGFHTGLISENYVYHTRGWVVENGNFTFEDNTWGTGADANAVDIAILATVNPEYYADIPALSAANNDAIVEDQRGGTNLLSHVYVDDDAAAGGDGTPAKPYQTIAEAIDRVVPGGTVHIANGTYAEKVTIRKAVKIIGESRDGVIIDASASTVYGIDANGNFATSFKNFTLIGPASAPGSFGIKIAGENAETTITNVLVKNSARTGLDLNGLNRAVITDVELINNGGNGLSLTNSSNVTVTNITTSGNAWGGVAVYTDSTSYSQGADNINITGTNSSNEPVGFYAEIDPDYPPTNLNVPEFHFTVVNNTDRENFTFYAKDQAYAVLIATNMPHPEDSYIRDIATSNLLVFPGMTIQAAIDAANPGDTVLVAAGTYVENVDTGDTRIIQGLTVRGLPDAENNYPLVKGSMKFGKPKGTEGDYAHKNLILENFRIEANLTDTSLYGSYRHALRVENFENTQLRNLELVGTEPDAMTAITYGISVGSRAKDYTIENVTMENFQIGVNGRALNMTIKDSDISNVLTGVNNMSGGNLTITDSSIVTKVTSHEKNLYVVRFGEGNVVGAPTVLDLHISNSTLAMSLPENFTPDPSYYLRSLVLRGNAGGDLVIANSNIPQGILNISSVPITADGNWWGSADKPVVDEDYVGLVNFCSWLDAPTPDGELLGDGMVTNQRTGHYYCSIQAAIDDAEAGDVLVASAGTFVEQIVIDKAITLQGPNFEKTGYAEDRVAEAIVTFPEGITEQAQRLVNVTASDVSIVGLKFEYGEHMLNLLPYMIRTNGVDNLTVKNNIIYGGEAGIHAAPVGTVNNTGLLVEGNLIDGGPFVNSRYNRGMYIYRMGGLIQNNVIDHVSIGIQFLPHREPTGLTAQYNDIKAYSIGLYNNNQYAGSGPHKWIANTVGVAENPRGTAEMGVYLPYTTDVTFRGIHVINHGLYGGTGEPPLAEFYNNILDGTYDPATTVGMASTTAVRISSANPDSNEGPSVPGTKTIVHNNAFDNFDTYINNTTTVNIDPNLLDASGNWWGTTDAAALFAGVTAGSDYTPWLASGTDNDADVAGFQGDFSTLYVDDDSFQVGAVGRIQEAIDLVSGSTIYVLPGTYQEAVVVDKAVNLYGPNMDVNPNGTVNRGPEAIILGSTTAPAMSTLFELDAENVVVKGFTFDNVRINNYIDGGATGTLTNQFGGVDISNNIFTNVSGTALYLRDGRNAPGEYSADVTVQNNLFNAITSAGGVDYNAGSAVVVMGGENLLVDGNVIEDAAYNGIQLARNNNVTVSNNTAVADQPAIQIAQWNEGTQTISGNDLQTSHASKAAMRFYAFTADRTPSFVIENNVIHDSVNGIQIGHGDAGKGDDISTADYSFAGNTFTDITGHELVVYLPAEATADQLTEMVEDFRQVYDAGAYVKEINGVDPYTYVVNYAPVAVDDAYTVEEDHELVVSAAEGVLANDTDAEGDPLTAVLVTGPTHAAVNGFTLNPDGSFSYKPGQDYFGEDTFTYKIVSGETTSNIATVTITVTPVKDPVQANDDFYFVNQNAVLEVPAPGVLGNDVDVDLNNQYAALVSGPTHGHLNFRNDGSFTYTPETDFFGEDTFVYQLITTPRISSDPWVDTATVTITVIPLPVISSPDIEGPYTVGVRREFNITLTNPVDGALYMSLSAYVFIDNITLADFEKVEVFHPIAQDWVQLIPEVDGTGLRINLAPTGDFPLLPDQTVTLTFRVTFLTAGTYPAEGSLYDTSGATPVKIASYETTLTVNNPPNTLAEQIASAPTYVYDPVYEYVGDFAYDAASLTYTATYTAPEYLAGGAMNDLARYLGALYRQDGSTINKLTYDGVDYTWQPGNPPLAGSNWKDANGVTLVSVIVADLANQVPGNLTVTVADSFYTEDVSFVVDATNTLDDEIESAPAYVYDPVYTYVGTFAFDDASNTYTATYTDVNYNPGALYDLARYLGALYRQANATVIGIHYNGVDYTWNPNGTNKGSNWEDANGTTLVSVVGADFQNGLIDPGTGVTFTVSDGIHTETVTFIIVINDTTAPEIVSITAIGADGFENVAAVNGVITVDQGYTVDRAEIVLNEAVTVVEGTVVKIGTTPYGTITADGTKLTVVPYAGNEIASLPGTFEFSVPAGSVKDLAGNALVQLGATLVVNNVAPVAVADAYTTNQDVALNVSAPGVLANDVDWTPITAILVTDVSHGELTLNADGSFSYTPAAGYNGTDSFTYKASDGELESEVVTVTITVNDNVAPEVISVTAIGADGFGDVVAVGSVITVDQGYTVARTEIVLNEAVTVEPGTEVSIGGQPYGSIVADGNLLTVTPYGNNGIASIPGTFVLSIPAGSVKDLAGNILPDANVTLVVNNVAPVAVADAYTTNQGVELVVGAPGVLANDFDWTPITAVLVTNVSHGTLTLNADGSFSYTPAVDYNGTDSFTYKAYDGKLYSDVTTVTITVVDNVAPEVVSVTAIGADGFDDVVAVGSTLTVDQGYTVARTEIVLNEAVTVEVGTEVSIGGQPYGSITASGSMLTVTPYGSNGIASIPGTFMLSIPAGSVKDLAGNALADTVVTLNVVNVAPVAVADAYTTNQGVELVVPVPGVLANDVDWTPLIAELVTDVSHGTLALNPNGSFSYTPDAGWSGVDSFSYKANDGLADSNVVTVTITVVDNVAPEVVSVTAIGADGFGDVVAVGNVITVDQGYTVARTEIALTEAVTVEPGTEVSVHGQPYGSIVADGSLLTVTPYGSNGIASLPGTFVLSIPAGSVKDLAGNELAEMSITLKVNNVAPVAVADAYTTNQDVALVVGAPGILSNDFDWTPITAVLVGGVGHGTLEFNGDGSFSYTPAAGYNGTDNFSYKAYDGELYSEVVTVTITVVDNVAPEVVSVTAIGADGFGDVVAVGSTLTVDQGYTVARTEIVLNEVVTVEAGTEVSIGGQPYGTITADGTKLTVVPYAGNEVATLPGTFEFSVPAGSVKDLAGNALVQLGATLVVNNVAPVANDDAYTTEEDILLTVAVPGVLANDVDWTPLTVTLVGEGTANGTLTLNADGSFSYMPNANWHGTDSFTYKVSDGELESNTATVTITVTPVKDPVSAVDDFYFVNENAVLTVPAPGVMANDKDPDGNERRVVLDTDVEHGTLKLNADGSFIYTPDADWSGEDSFIYELITYPKTQSLWTDTATVTITVIPMPIISSDDVVGPYFVGEQQEFHVTLTNPVGGATYTSMSASIFVDNIGLDDFESVEVLHPVHDIWVPLTPVVEGSGLRLVVGPTSNYEVGPGESVTLTFRGTFNTAGSYTGTGTLFCHDSGEPVAIGTLTDTMVVYARPVISSDDVAGPYYVGEQREFHVTLDNTNGTTYTSMSASIFVDNIGLDDFDSVEVKHPVTGAWIALTPVVEGTGLRLVVGPTSNYEVGPNESVTLTFRGTFNTAGSYTGTGTLYCHDSGEPVKIGSLTATMVVYARPVISSDDLAGPYHVGALGSFSVTLSNPADGDSYDNLSASIVIENIGLEDFTSIEVKHPINGNWITLSPVEQGENIVLNIPMTDAFAIVPGTVWTLEFRGTFKTAGNYPASGILYCHDSGAPVVIGTLNDTMVVKPASPVISSDDLAGPYFVSEPGSFSVTMTNPADGGTYLNLSALIVIEGIGLDDFTSIEVKHPVSGAWIVLSPEEQGENVVLDIPVTGAFAITPGKIWTLEFRGEFLTPGSYVASGILYSHDGGEAIEIGSLTDTMVVYARPVISSDDLAGPYFVGELQEFHVTLDNTDGTTYTSMSASIFVDNIGLADFAVAEVKHPVTGAWIGLTPVVDGTGLKLVVGPTSNYEVGPNESVTLTFRVEFNTAGEYEATGTLYCHDSGVAVEIGSLTDTMVVYARPVISSDDLAGPYFVGELQEFHVTLDNTNGTTYTSMSASIFVDNIGLADFAVAEVKHPVTGAWIGLTPVVDGTGLRLNIGPTSNYEVGPNESVTLTFRVEFNTAGEYEATGTLYCHDSGVAVEIGSLTDTMVVYARPVISSDDLAGPYFVGELQEFHVTLDNTNGTTYTSMSASIFVDNIGLADFAVAEVKHPVTGAWIGLTPVVDGTGLKLVVGPTSNYEVGPNESVTLTFRVEFNTAGEYEATGTLYCHDSGVAVEIGSLTDTMVVYARPVISSDDLAGPYFVGELQEFHVTLDNTDGTTYTSMSASIFVDNIGLADFAVAEVKHPVTGQWIGLTPVVDGTGLRLVVGPTSNYEVGPNESVTLTFRVEFNTAGEYEATGTLYCHDSGVAVEIGSLTDTMVVYARPVISSTDIEGPYTVGVRRDFHVTLTNPADGATYTNLSVSVFVDDITFADYEKVEVLHPVYGTWVELTPVIDGDGLRLDLGPTGQFPLVPGQVVTLTFRVTFLTAGTYPAEGSLYDTSGTTPVEIASFSATLTVNNPPNTLPEQIASAPSYVYDDGYVYVGDFAYDAASLTYTTTYTAPEYLAGGAMSDLARYLGALYRQTGATINKVTYKGVDYSWNLAEPLKGSNWEDENGITLVSVIVADLANQVPGNLTLTVADNFYTEDVSFVVNVTNTLDAEIESAPAYVYDPVYTYVGTFAFDDASNTYTATYTDVNYNPGAMNDLARYLGALHRQANATVIKVTYKGVDYTWNPAEPLKGSNWEDENGTTLVSVVTADFQNGLIDPGTGVTFTVSDGIHTETVTFIIVINDTTAPEIVSITAIGADGFENVAAVNGVITVDQGYVVERTEIVLNEVVTVEAGTVVSIGGQPYGTITADGTKLTVVPYAGNEIASLPGTFEFSVPAGSVKDLAGNALLDLDVTLIVNNVAPVANDDAYTTEEDILLTVAVPGVLANDVDWTPLTVTLVGEGTANGTLTLNADGSFSYMPNANWYGTDSFTYKVSDGELESNTATVTITVTPVKDPVNAVDDEYETDEDVVLIVSAEDGVLSNDLDPDGNERRAVLVTGVAHGTLKLNADGSFIYTPDADWSGEDSFIYELITYPKTQSLWTDTATVTITVHPVNDAPVLDEIADATIPEMVLFSFTATATDVDSTNLTFSLINAPDGASINAATGVFTWTPTEAQGPGVYTFTVKVCDDAEPVLCDQQTLTITVEEVNLAPRLYPIVDDEYTVDEETQLTVTFLAEDDDLPAQTLTFALIDAPEGAVINPVTGVFSWTPTEAQGPGVYEFTVTVCDNGAPVLCDEQLITVTVEEVNLPPVLAEIADTTIPEMVLYSFTATATDPDLPAQTLTFSLVSAPDGASIDAATGVFTWTPTEAQGPGVYEFTVKVCDDGAPVLCDEQLVTLTVEEVNLPPVLAEIADATIPEMVQYSFTATATDPDLPAQTLTFSLVDAPEGAAINGTTGVFTWTPTEAQGPGVYTFTVKVCDNGDPVLCDEQLITLTVEEVNLPPVLADIADATIPEMVQYSFTATATDPDLPAQTLTYSLVDAPEGATINSATGVFTWTPTEAQGPGVYEFTVKVCDNGDPVLCDEQLITLTVEEVNLPPVLAEIGDQVVEAGEELMFTATATDPDLPTQTLTFSLLGAPDGASIDPATGVFTWTPTVDQAGEHTVTVCVSDGELEDCEEITITVNYINLAPVAVADTYTTDEDVVLTVAAPGVLENDSDPNGDALTAILVDGVDHGTLTFNADGSFVYTPEQDYNGTDSFTYKASDGELESEVVTVTITINPVNDAPVAVDDAYTTAEDVILVVAAPGVLANDYDVDGDTLTATLRTGVSHGTLTLMSDGSFTYLPDPDFFGTDSFTYNLITYPGTTSEWTDWATVTITVTPVNDAPVLDEIPDATIPEMVLYTFTATATDVDSTNLTFSLINPPAGASINATTGVFTWTPTEAQGPGVFTFTVKVCDDGTPVLCDQQLVTITVEEVNLAPELDPIENQEVEVGTLLTFTVTASDPDLPVQTLIFYLDGAPVGASINAATGVFTWIPVESQVGVHVFDICVSDGELEDCQEIKVTVLEGDVNTAPVARPDAYEVDFEGVLSVAAPGVLANDTDADGDELTAILVSTTANGTLTFNSDGSFLYIPRAGFSGTDTFRYKANDGELDSNIVTVTITVKAAPPQPVYRLWLPIIKK